MRKKTVLILGGTGFVGSYLRDHLKDTYRVVTTSRSGADADYAFDLSRVPFSQELFADAAPDAIVNCTVGYGATLEECFEVNVRQSAALFMALSKRALHFVQLSSVSATAENKHQSPYGITKYVSDELLSYCASSSVLKATILRFSQIFDAAGRSAKSQPGLAAWVRSIKEGEPIQVYARTPQKRSYIPVETVVRAIGFTLDTEILGAHDVIGPDAYTPQELVEKLASLAGYDRSKIVLVDKTALGYSIPACSPRFERWMSAQEPCVSYFARLFDRPDNDLP